MDAYLVWEIRRFGTRAKALYTFSDGRAESSRECVEAPLEQRPKVAFMAWKLESLSER